MAIGHWIVNRIKSANSLECMECSYKIIDCITKLTQLLNLDKDRGQLRQLRGI